MADWTNPPYAQLVAGKPWTDEKAAAAYENTVALAEGASGAPRIVDGALDTTATTAGLTWVRNRYALTSGGAKGTPAFLRTTVAGSYTIGDTLPGSSLAYTSAAGGTGGPPSGIWMCLGAAFGGETSPSGQPTAATSWLRIS